MWEPSTSYPVRRIEKEQKGHCCTTIPPTQQRKRVFPAPQKPRKRSGTRHGRQGRRGQGQGPSPGNSNLHQLGPPTWTPLHCSGMLISKFTQQSTRWLQEKGAIMPLSVGACSYNVSHPASLSHFVPFCLGLSSLGPRFLCDPQTMEHPVHTVFQAMTKALPLAHH